MAPGIFSVKFPYDTQFTFGSLMFAVREDGNLELLTHGPTLKQLALVYGHAPYLSASSSTSGGACSDLNPYAGPYHPAAKTTQGILIGAPIFQPLIKTQPMITPRLEETPIGTPPMRVALSSWWPRSEYRRTIAPTDTHYREIGSVRCPDAQ
jgi:hypothetical protein